MENREQQILSDIKEMMSSIMQQVEYLEKKIMELHSEMDPQVQNPEPIDLSLDDFSFDAEVVPFSDEPEEPVSESELLVMEQEDVVQEPVEDAVPVVKSQEAVIDAMTAKQAWRKDMPGAPVRDVRSAISLNDRVLFINVLFDEDPLKFQEVLSSINQMTSFDEAAEMIMNSYPSWDFESDTVYRFMMAIRRRLN